MSTFPDGEVYLSKLKYGVSDSDSVRRLQVRLNEVPPTEITPLAVNGNYDSATDLAVIAWQKSIGDTPDKPGQSFLGPKQAELLFKDSGNELINDLNATTLGKYLRGQGLNVVDSNVPLGRAAAWTGVKWILVHHTATPDSWTEQQVADFVKFGREFPPLSQIVLGKSGTVWMCAQQRAGQAEPGRATHAGEGIWPGVPKDRMNEYSIGIECQNNGKTALIKTPGQYDALIKLLVALCKRYNLDETKILGHKEWSTTGKIDPLDDMRKIRADVKFALAGATNPVDPPKPPVVSPKPPMTPPVAPEGVVDWDDYSGKPTTTFTVLESDGWKKLDTKIEANPIGGHEERMAYWRVVFKDAKVDYWKPGSGMAKVECQWVRDGGTPGDPSDDDPTAMDERHYEHGTKSVPFQMMHFESGEPKVGGAWYVRVHGGVSGAKITTRYSKGWAIRVND